MCRKGYKMSEEAREKMRQAKLANPVRHWLDKKRPDISELRKGVIFTDEHKEKLSRAKLEKPTRYWLGKKRPEILNWLTPYQKGYESPYKGKKRPEVAGPNQPTWKGEEVGYRNLHRWVERQMGKPEKCSECEKVGYGRCMHWANKSGEYKRDVSDWLRLCSSCHGAYDKEKGLRKRLLTIK